MKADAGPEHETSHETTTSVRGQQATVECIECIRATLQNRISVNIPNNVEMATELLRHLGDLRCLLSSDGPDLALTLAVAKTGFVELVMSNVTVLLRYENVTDECLRVLTPLTRIADADSTTEGGEGGSTVLALQRRLMSQMFQSGGVVFVLLALRGYMHSSLGVRLQGLEVLSALLEYVALTSPDASAPGADADAGPEQAHSAAEKGMSVSFRPSSPGGQRADYQGTEVPRYAAGAGSRESSYASAAHRRELRELVSLPQNGAVQDCVHQLLLHGAGVVLTRLLQYSVAAGSDIAARRAIWCLRFLLLDTPPSLAVKVAKYDQYIVISSLASQLRAPSKIARMEAATLLTALLSADVDVCAALTDMGGWDELSSVLAQSAELVHIPPHWLAGSLENIKRMDQGGANLAPAPHRASSSVPAPHNNGADDVSDVETALLNGGESFEDVLQGLLRNTQQSARERAGRWSRPVSRSSTGSGGLGRSASHKTMNTYANIPSGGAATTTMSTGNLHSTGTSEQQFGVGASGSLSGSPHRQVKNEPFDIQKTRFAQSLKESPFGHPVNPDELRRVKQQNGGKLPLHIPHALGGPKLGHRPGPDYGSKKKKKKKKKKKVVGSGLGQTPTTSRPTSAAAFPAFSQTANLHPTPGSHAVDDALEREKRASLKVAKQASFIAHKLFDGPDASAASAVASAAPEPSMSQDKDKGSAVEKLNFAERLQCMIMQVQELN